MEQTKCNKILFEMIRKFCEINSDLKIRISDLLHLFLRSRFGYVLFLSCLIN